jgi:predicted RNA binding protein YcfA (HicA-like mRNA interferase family)
LSKLPVISGKKLCILFTRLDYAIDHQTGGHIILRNNNYPYRRLTIPNHKDVSKGTLRSIITQAGLTLKEFKDLLGS